MKFQLYKAIIIFLLGCAIWLGAVQAYEHQLFSKETLNWIMSITGIATVGALFGYHQYVKWYNEKH